MHGSDCGRSGPKVVCFARCMTKTKIRVTAYTGIEVPGGLPSLGEP